MTDLTQHPQVERIGNYLFVVTGPNDTYAVEAEQDPIGDWSAGPTIDSPSCRNANLRTREEAEAWAERTTTRHTSLQAALMYALTRVGAA